MKKKFLRLTVGLFVCLCVIFTVKAATTDTTAPSMKSFSVKNPKNSYEVGETVYLNLKANDDISGIQGAYLFIGQYNDNNEFSGTGVDIYDINDNPYFIVPADWANKHVVIAEIDFKDNAGNQSNYSFNKTEADNFGMNYYNYDFSFDITALKSDVIGPTLNNITFDKNNFKYGESININVSASDDKSGVWGASLAFKLEGTNKLFYKDIQADETGKLVGKFAVPSYNGTYKLTGVSLYDYNSNGSSYGIDDYDQKCEHELNVDYSFTVTGAPDVDENISISKIDYAYKQLPAPNIYKIGIQLNKNTDLVNSATIIAAKKDNENRVLTAELFKDDNGYLSGYFDIDQFVSNGVYYIKEIVLNGQNNSNVLRQINENLNYENVSIFEIVDNDMFDVITSTTDENLIEKIKTASDNAKIAISSTNSTIVKKGVFKAIKGTNKTIYIESNGIQWVFNGQDIIKPKDIDVNTTVNYIYDDDLNSLIGSYIENGLVLNFENNGKLPGLALIRVKTDYALRNYIGEENLQVYYYNQNEAEMFDAVANNIGMNEFGYLEFMINHNSSFVISNNKIDDEYVSDEVSDLALNDKKVSVENEQLEQANNLKNILIVVGICILIVAIITAIIILVKHKKRKSMTE